MGYGREMDGCGQFIKYSLFFANFLIFVGGIVVMGIGIWTLVDKSQLNALLGTNLFLGAAYILIITGIDVVLIAFFGCMGAVREIKCMLLTQNFMMIFLIFVTMLVGGILGYVFREEMSDTMEQEMQKSLGLYNHPEHKEVTESWDYIQQNLKCCGASGPSNWRYGPIPTSCCVNRVFNSSLCTAIPNNIYTDGCLERTVGIVKDHAATLGGAGVGVACLMVLAMIFSCALFNMIE